VACRKSTTSQHKIASDNTRDRTMAKRTHKAPAGSAQKHRSTRTAGHSLTFGDRYRLLELHRANPTWTYQELADNFGCTKETAHRTCVAASKSAADLMAAYAAPMLSQWIKASRSASSRGDHRPARDWLLHAGSIDPLPDTARHSGPAVVIVNAPLPGMPGAIAIGTPTTIDGETIAPVPASLPVKPESS
jgi:hypothetical protein